MIAATSEVSDPSFASCAGDAQRARTRGETHAHKTERLQCVCGVCSVHACLVRAAWHPPLSSGTVVYAVRRPAAAACVRACLRVRACVCARKQHHMRRLSQGGGGRAAPPAQGRCRAALQLYRAAGSGALQGSFKPQPFGRGEAVNLNVHADLQRDAQVLFGFILRGALRAVLRR